MGIFQTMAVEGGGKSIIKVAGIIVGVIVISFLLCVVCCCWCVFRKRQRAGKIHRPPACNSGEPSGDVLLTGGVPSQSPPQPPAYSEAPPSYSVRPRLLNSLLIILISCDPIVDY